MIHSRASQYAIRAILFLAKEGSSELCTLDSIASHEGIPQPFLAKIMQRLAKKKLVKSVKGIGGGFRLNVPSSQLTLYQIVDAIDDLTVISSRCILGHEVCSDETACPLHRSWLALKNRELSFLQRTSIFDILAGESQKSSKKNLHLIEWGPEKIV